MWVKGAIKQDNTNELYTIAYERALKHRRSSNTEQSHVEMLHAEMLQLYAFWSHFLCRNFNPTMYSEFKRFAAEDAEKNVMDGVKHLVAYYDNCLQDKKKVIPDFLARDYVTLVKKELAQADKSDRIALKKLRSAWRDGALDLRSRKKIGDLAGAELKEELEQ